MTSPHTTSSPFGSGSIEGREQSNHGLSPELFAKIKQIQIRTQRLVTDAMAGEYESAFKGHGMEFEQVREYQPGDDIRHIDWNVTARLGAPFVKEHREERELTVMLLVDVSSSGSFGSVDRFKNEVAAEVAAILAYSAIRNNDRVGVVLFSDCIESYVPPKKGRAHVWRVIREILGFRGEGRRRGTDLEMALEYVNKVTSRRMVGFVISDFLDDGYERQLRASARRHDMTAVVVSDPREKSLPRIGLLELEDSETGEIRLVDTFDRRALDEVERQRELASAARAQLFRSAGVGQVEVSTGESCVDAIIRFFRSREGSRASVRRR
jgi:uncharacterized protein (DUF58 family)